MNHQTKQVPPHPLVLVAGCCSVASVGIIALAFCLLSEISGTEMWAVAAMAAAPPLMGIAIAYFMTRHAPQHASSTA